MVGRSSDSRRDRNARPHGGREPHRGPGGSQAGPRRSRRRRMALDLPMQGGPSTLNPSSGDGTHGASWRMVVELGPELRAWGTYPGGQSGNPLSRRYDDRIAKWVNGE